MSTTGHQVATGQPFSPGSQNEVSRDSQPTQDGKDKVEAQINAYLSSADSQATDNTGIQRRTLKCQELFEACQKNPYLSGDDWIDKMSAEFNWWSLGIGAAKGGRSSLDHRVQTRDDVRNELVHLLGSLAISLEKYNNAASQPYNPSQSTIPPAQYEDLEGAAAYDSNPQPSSDDSLIDEQRYYIETTIRFLSRISMAIRKSGTKFRHQRVDKLLATRESELKEFGDYLRLLVLMSPRKVHHLHRISLKHTLTGDPNWGSLWSMAKAYFTDIRRLTPVQERLIQANLVRRNRFDLYLRQYHQKIKAQKGTQLLYGQAETLTKSPPSPAPNQSHVAQTPSRQGGKTPIEPLEIEGSQRSSQSATKIGSFVMPLGPQQQKARSVSTKLSQGVLKQDYPKCPGVEGKSFWCPYCAQLLDSSYSDPKKNKRWRGHVVEDLSPYVCVYEDCDSPDAMYITTAEWKKHIRDSHSRAQWICDPCWLNSDIPEEFEFESQEEWCKHTLKEHEEEVDECDLPDLTELSQRTGVPLIACPLCYEDVSLRNPETDKHLAEHLHSFALQALPWELAGCDDKTQVSMGSDIRKSHDSGDSEQSTMEESQDSGDEVTAIQNLVSAIKTRSAVVLRNSHYHPPTSFSGLLVKLQAYFGHLSIRPNDYRPSFRPEVLECLARLDSIMQRHEDESSDPKERESVNMWEEDLVQVFESFQKLDPLATATLGEQLDHFKLHGQDGTGSERSHYIPRYRLEAFWEVRDINAILRDNSVNQPKEVIFQSFLCTFSLLVYVNKADFLGWLVERNIKDATFPLETRPPSWPDTPPYLELFEAITKSQWIFFPVTFEQHELYNQIFTPHYIFPICAEELIKAGDIVQVHKIETNPSYEGSDQATYVRKAYNESGKVQYEREVKAFTNLQSRSSPNIISYHGCYQQQRLDGTITYNLIMGFVDGGNLEEFYTHMNPPRSLLDTKKVWNAFCGVLEGLHHLSFAAAIDTNFQTIHQDIEPDNLLVSKPALSQPYDFRLVITDFGRSYTKASRTSQDTWGIHSHGGQVYGAPESSDHADYTRRGRTPITPKVDIWSLGCVMSETAVWIKSGLQGLEQYRNRCISETRTLSRFDEAGYGGCFHDGVHALDAVRFTHDLVRNSFPDTVTLQVLDMIETSMLVPQGDRQEAQFLCERLAKIIQAASSGHQYESPPASSLPRIQAHPAPLDPPWIHLPQASVFPPVMESMTPLSPMIELPGSQPSGTHPLVPPTAVTPSNIRHPSLSPPILTFEQAWSWYRHVKKDPRPFDPRVEGVVQQLGNNVKGRDHIFFVDVSPSMGLHFQEIKEKFQILAYLAKQFDPDGIEVCFSSEVPLIHKGDTSKLLRKFNNQKWDQLSFEDTFGTFIDRIVIPRLSSWQQKLRLTKPKNITIFVLTDGRWGEDIEGAAGVESPIMRLINVILREKLSRVQVAIQFLRFGDDPDGKRYLRYLDHFGTQYKCDIVDTKPIDGNIFDMFIGPINPDIDGVDEDEL